MGKHKRVKQKTKRATGTGVSVCSDYFPAPSYLTATAKSYWKETIEAFPKHYFDEADKVLLEQYCEAAAQHQNATATLNKEGRKYKDRYDNLRPNPAAADQSKARSECSMLATKLRITKQARISPQVSGRASVEANKANETNQEFGDLLFDGSNVASVEQ